MVNANPVQTFYRGRAGLEIKNNKLDLNLACIDSVGATEASIVLWVLSGKLQLRISTRMTQIFYYYSTDSHNYFYLTVLRSEVSKTELLSNVTTENIERNAAASSSSKSLMHEGQEETSNCKLN